MSAGRVGREIAWRSCESVAYGQYAGGRFSDELGCDVRLNRERMVCRGFDFRLLSMALEVSADHEYIFRSYCGAFDDVDNGRLRYLNCPLVSRKASLSDELKCSMDAMLHRILKYTARGFR